VGNWCALFLSILAGLAQVVLAVTSNLFDGWDRWDDLPGKAKAAVWAGLSILLGLGAWFGATRLPCPDVPDLATALYGIANVVWGFFFNGYRHERRLRKAGV
jgi:hypothetical protein